MLKIGLTGGIACGKSTVADLLVKRGALLLDADLLAREAVVPGEPAWQEIRAWLDDSHFFTDGTLNRGRVAALIFASPSARKRLNAIVHPHVIARLRQCSRKLEEEKKDGILIWDVPLMFETGTEGEVDRILVVASRERIQIDRLKKRNNLTAEEARRRIRSQMPLAQKIKAADYVVYNNGDMNELVGQVELFWQNITGGD